MKILVVDDGQLAINSLIRILCRVAPDCDYISAMTTEDALSWMRQGPMDAAFLNLEMPGMNGLALTRMIQKLQPRCNIIVVTEHPEYALEALQIFVSGFLLKPANEADVRNVLEHLRYPPENAPVGIKIQCFGNFEIFVGGRALAFKRSKSKELLAYLVDRNGATCTNGEMLAVLWEDKPDTASLHSHLRNLIFDLSHTLHLLKVPLSECPRFLLSSGQFRVQETLQPTHPRIYQSPVREENPLPRKSHGSLMYLLSFSGIPTHLSPAFPEMHDRSPDSAFLSSYGSGS